MGPERFDVVIVGAGAAGMAAAIFAARRGPRFRIVCLDGARRLGAKILVSGGGRCNVTNVRITPEDFWGGSRNSIRRVLNAFTGPQTVEFFAEIGVSLHEEQWGKLFPDSHSAKTVLEALIVEAKRRGIALLAGHRVTAVDRQEGGGFLVTATLGQGVGTTDGHYGCPSAFETAAVVLATGGQSLPKTGSDGFGFELARRLGHSIVSPTPALAPLIFDGDFHVPLSGVSHEEIEVLVRAEGQRPLRIRGPMVWTHFGASGPAIMDASRHWHRARLEQKGVELSLCLLPDEDFEQVDGRLIELARTQPNALVHNAVIAMLPARLVERMVLRLGISPRVTMGRLTREDRRRLAHAMLDWPLPVIDSRGYNFAEATAGGVPLNEVDPATMASRVCPGLFFVGEILDVDGRIGGFNFQWAWSSGHVAAVGLDRYLDSP